VTNGAECKNCGVTLAGRYCSACGQPADVRVPSFGHLLLDALGDAFSFDSRVWRSLGALVLPGRLTRRFLEGQRAKYTPPFRLYVVTTLVFFALFSIGRMMTGPPKPASSPPEENTADEPSPATTEDEQFGIDVKNGRWNCNLDKNLPPPMRARLVAACERIEADSGASFMRALAEHFPVMMLFFIPAIAGLMKLLYAFSRRKYVEHLLFFVHVHTFFFLTGVVTTLALRAAGLVPFLTSPVRAVTFVAWLYFPIYVYLAMRYVYRQGRVLTAVKYVALWGGYFVAFLASLSGLLIYTAVTL